MARAFPLRANLGRPKPKKNRKRRRGAPKPAAISTTVGLADKAAAARKEAINKLLAIRKSGSSTQKRKAVTSTLAVQRVELPDLRNMSLPTILRVWKNAVRLAASADAKKATVGLGAISAIEKEWSRRGLTPLNPDDHFAWPTTEARGGHGEVAFGELLREGVFSYLEYHVGRTNGESPSVRKVILDRVFIGVLPPVFPRDYLAEWSSPSSAGRLQKMAESIAAFCRNAKRRDTSKLDDAIKDWESDLNYLREQYYVGKFHFGWPASSIQ